MTASLKCVCNYSPEGNSEYVEEAYLPNVRFLVLITICQGAFHRTLLRGDSSTHYIWIDQENVIMPPADASGESFTERLLVLIRISSELENLYLLCNIYDLLIKTKQVESPVFH